MESPGSGVKVLVARLISSVTSGKLISLPPCVNNNDNAEWGHCED